MCVRERESVHGMCVLISQIVPASLPSLPLSPLSSYLISVPLEASLKGTLVFVD